MANDPAIVIIPGLAGRTIKSVTKWSDDHSTMSILFVDGDILQVTALGHEEERDGELHIRLEARGNG